MCCVQGEKFLCEADYLKSVQAVQFQFVAPNAAAVVQQQGADSSTLGEWSTAVVYGVHVQSSLQCRHSSPGHTLSMVISVCVHTYVCMYSLSFPLHVAWKFVVACVCVCVCACV